MWDWQSFFIKIGIPAGVSSRYAEVFRQNRVSKDMLSDLDKATLADLGVTAVGDQLAILRSAKDASLDLESVTPAKLRVRITGPGSNGETSTNGSTLSTNENRRGKPPPDRHEIYHIKMPEGNTARTRQIMQNASMMRRHGLAVRGTTGVRQGGRSVSPIDKKSVAVMRMRQEREELMTTDPIISRLGVRGLHSDVNVKSASGKVLKRSDRTQARLSGARWAKTGEDVAVRVQIPAGNVVTRRLPASHRSAVSTSIVNRISRNRSIDIPRVTVKLRGTTPKERTIIRSRGVDRRPVHARLGKLTTGGRLPGPSRVNQRFVRDEPVIDDDEMSVEEEEYSDGDVWEEDDMQYDEDEYVEEVRPTRPHNTVHDRMYKFFFAFFSETYGCLFEEAFHLPALPVLVPNRW
ncbi:hypothetical protein Y032_0307g2016 [Ancylostoma ceylanicum]|uniref:SAM domain-containing protein n=1 Tax=Ancylostoma ceylanicum TaxID=53326 RepID=A0A016S2N5_9BILA|nr:hypothetical protein Y032_0307g2016 [Ancylostoma ceylanicum]